MASVKPWQRRSSAALPTSWLTQSAFVTPASAMRSPPPKPASYSVWPTWVSTPSSSATSQPEFIEMTGMPASIAAVMEGPSASASGMETTSPSGSEATAASISCAIATMSKVPGAWYSTVTPRSSPRLVDAVLHDRPEGIGRLPVGDDDDANLVVLRRNWLDERAQPGHHDNGQNAKESD